MRITENVDLSCTFQIEIKRKEIKGKDGYKSGNQGRENELARLQLKVDEEKRRKTELLREIRTYE